VVYDRAGTGWSDDVRLPRSAGVRRPLVDYHVSALRKTLQERKNLLTEVETELREGEDMPDVPVLVLASMGIDPFMAALLPEAQLRELNSQKAALYRPLVESVPRGEYRAVEGAGGRPGPSGLERSPRRRGRRPGPGRADSH
jgi:hypothetical protein